MRSIQTDRWMHIVLPISCVCTHFLAKRVQFTCNITIIAILFESKWNVTNSNSQIGAQIKWMQVNCRAQIHVRRDGNQYWIQENRFRLKRCYINHGTFSFLIKQPFTAARSIRRQSAPQQGLFALMTCNWTAKWHLFCETKLSWIKIKLTDFFDPVWNFKPFFLS